ncbi:MAG: RluA family pseudouridine synthase [Bacteroidota bacterium]
MIEEEISEEVTEEAEDGLYEHHRIVVDKGQTLLRIDKFLFNRIEKVSRSRIQRAADSGGVLVNGDPVNSNYRVRPNDLITIMLPEPKTEYDVIPENIPLNFIYEDEDIAIVNKNPGLVVHPGVGNSSGTLVNGLLFHFNQLPSATGNEVRPGLVHRIDKDTSGLLVVAKNEYALNFLAKQFADHTIDRKYIALVWGNVKDEEGTVTGHIGRNLKDRKKMDIFPDGDHGKEAVTHYKVKERFHYTTLIECTLETGRTHQIRVHMKSIGHPLFNDSTYGGDKIVRGTIYKKYSQFVNNCFEACPRQALHAASLGFTHPTTLKHIFFDSELPDDMKDLVNRWRKYFEAVSKKE